MPNDPRRPPPTPGIPGVPVPPGPPSILPAGGGTARRPRPTVPPAGSELPAERLAELLSRYLRTSGMESRLKQSAVLEEWPRLVGPEIGAVTRALSITDDGTLFVAVRNNAWMAELTMMERELLASVNRITGDKPILKLRWQLMR